MNTGSCNNVIGSRTDCNGKEIDDSSSQDGGHRICRPRICSCRAVSLWRDGWQGSRYYLEQKFQANLHKKYDYIEGSSAKGIDFPELNVDIKVTSIKQPQSSCPFKSARQKIYGLGYNLLVFVYEKSDDEQTKTGSLNIHHTIFVDKSQTADFQTTNGIRSILENDANLDDMLAFFSDKMLPLDDIQAQELAEEVLANPPEIGYLTISNALQWRLQYSRVIQQAGTIVGIEKL